MACQSGSCSQVDSAKTQCSSDWPLSSNVRNRGPAANPALDSALSRLLHSAEALRAAGGYDAVDNLSYLAISLQFAAVLQSLERLNSKFIGIFGMPCSTESSLPC